MGGQAGGGAGRFRVLWSRAAAGLAVVVLAACAQGPGEPPGDLPDPTMASSTPATAAPVSPTPVPGGASGPGSDPATPGWGAYEDREEACTAVTDDVLALSLVPTNVQLAEDSGDISGIGTTIVDRALRAPEGVRDSYAAAREVVEEFAQAKAGEDGGGPEAEFDQSRYEAAVEGIRDWLTTTCS